MWTWPFRSATAFAFRLGKFVTLLGQEAINPTGNALYSHSYLFGFAIPFTQTGVLVTYALNDKFTIDAGITRGWNQLSVTITATPTSSAASPTRWTRPPASCSAFLKARRPPAITMTGGPWST